MKISRTLSLTMPIDREDGSTVWVHSQPIGQEVFETYFMPISKAFSAIYGEGLGPIAGPRVAAMILKKISQEMGVWEGKGGVEAGLMAEIRRLTNVAMPGPNGWASIPWENAVKDGAIDKADIAEVENALVFFTCLSAMLRRVELEEALTVALPLWGGQVSSSPLMDFINSLPTSTPEGNSGESKTAV